MPSPSRRPRRSWRDGLGQRANGKAKVLIPAGVAAVVAVIILATITLTGGSHSSNTADDLRAQTATASSSSASPQATAGTVSTSIPKTKGKTKTKAAGRSGKHAQPGKSAKSAPHNSPSHKPKPKAAPTPTGPNLVQNGTFATGDLAPWSVAGYAVVTNLEAETGTFAVLMRSHGQGAGVAELITGLQPGTAYLLTGWAMSGQEGGITYIGAKNYSTTDPDGVSGGTTADTWTEESMLFTPGAGHHTALVWCWRLNAGPGYCDNLSVHAMS